MVEPKADSVSGLLTSRGISDVFHCVPLHYILFIARSRSLYSKINLRQFGFRDSHFRSTSRAADERRGFAGYVHLSIEAYPDILLAKLKRGFPHFAVRVAASHVQKYPLHLCCYNIAKTRNLRSGNRPSPEGEGTGWFHGSKEIPTAETVVECEALLINNRSRDIEVLVVSTLPLPADTELLFFNEADRQLAMTVLKPLNLTWQIGFGEERPYIPAERYVTAVRRYLERATSEPEWRGDGLGFDRV